MIDDFRDKLGEAVKLSDPSNQKAGQSSTSRQMELVSNSLSNISATCDKYAVKRNSDDWKTATLADRVKMVMKSKL